MKALKKFIKKFEDEMAAAAFAEAGEPETALEILKESSERDHHNGKKIGQILPNPAASK